MKIRSLLAPGLLLGAAALLLSPESAPAFSIIDPLGLDLDQRDWRVRNNFADSDANNNTNADANFPGWDGAELALWKAATEWGSQRHANGNGDPSQPGDLGSGDANFDFFFSGSATGAGGQNDNIVAAASCGGGAPFAFVETPINEGWRMTFCEEWTWSDGPSTAGGGRVDIQGIATHEFGHALGLGHSSAGIMVSGTFNGNNLRDLRADDIAGLQAIYGARAGDKVEIDSVSFNPTTAVVTITGSNFPTGQSGEIWFNNKDATAPGGDPFLRLTGVQATGTNPNMVLTAVIPFGAQSGDVHVKKGTNDNLGKNLSNGYPLNTQGIDPPNDLVIGSITPSPLEALQVGTAEVVTISGSGFTPATVVQVNGVDVADGFSYVDAGTMTLDPPLLAVGTHTIGVRKGPFTASQNVSVVHNAVGTLQVGTGDPGTSVVSDGDLFPMSVGGPLNSYHFLLASTFNVPSVIPGRLELDLGLGFFEVINVAEFLIPPSGSLSFNLNSNGLGGTTLYFQTASFTFPFSFPLESSNLQQIQVTF